MPIASISAADASPTAQPRTHAAAFGAIASRRGSLMSFVSRKPAGMRRAHDETPLYSWDENKGYSSPAHFAAIDEHGPSGLHRMTWLHDRSEPAPALFDLGVG